MLCLRDATKCLCSFWLSVNEQISRSIECSKYIILELKAFTQENCVVMVAATLIHIISGLSISQTFWFSHLFEAGLCLSV